MEMEKGKIYKISNVKPEKVMSTVKFKDLKTIGQFVDSIQSILTYGGDSLDFEKMINRVLNTHLGAETFFNQDSIIEEDVKCEDCNEDNCCKNE